MLLFMRCVILNCALSCIRIADRCFFSNIIKLFSPCLVDPCVCSVAAFGFLWELLNELNVDKYIVINSVKCYNMIVVF